jgi:predicted GNAT superfamily acetyltransferase
MEEIRQKLEAGAAAKDLIKSGFGKKTTVYKVKKQMKSRSQLPAVDDEVAELQHEKQVLKLKADIAELVALKEKLPDRVTTLEVEVVALRKLIRQAVNKALEALFTHTANLREPTQEIKEICRDWVERFVEAP